MGKENIVLKLDSSYKIKYEKIQEFDDSLFQGVYREANRMLNEIIERNEEYENDRYGGLREREREQICNIISFIGERGSGKTSSMLSFAEYLKAFHKIDIVEESLESCRSMQNKNKNKTVSFTVLDCIEATLLESNENIFEIILTKIFDKLDHLVNEHSNVIEGADPDYKQREINSMIAKLYKDLRFLYNKDKRADADELPLVSLKKLSSSWSLRRAFKSLIEAFTGAINYSNGMVNRRPFNFVVIPIDDIDLNVENCFEMLEIIRRYLMVPGVIILMNLSYDQLEAISRQHYNSIFKFRDTSKGSFEQRRLDLLTKEYIEKILPTGRKIYMPSIYGSLEIASKNIYVSSSYGNRSVDLTIRQCILDKLYRYMHLSFAADASERFFLEPASIRKLSNYLKEFDALDSLDGNANEDYLDRLDHNIAWFYNDIVYRLTKQNLSLEEREEVNRYITVNVEKRNWYFINKALNKYKEIYNSSGDIPEFAIYNKKRNSGWNMDNTYGNFVFALEHADRRNFFSKDFLDIVAVLQSCMLTRIVEHYQFARTKAKGEDASEEWGTRVDKWKNRLKDVTGGDWFDRMDQIFCGKSNILSQTKASKEVFMEIGILGRITEIDVNDVNRIEKLYQKDSELEGAASELIRKYQLVRMFFSENSYPAPVDRNGAFPIEVPEEENKILVCLRAVKGRCNFSIFHFVQSVFFYEDILYNWQNEYMVKAYRVRRSSDHEVKQEELNVKLPTTNGLLGDFKKWEKDYGTTCVIPFYNVGFMRFLYTYLEKELNKGTLELKEQIFLLFLKTGEAIQKFVAAYDEIWDAVTDNDGSKQTGKAGPVRKEEMESKVAYVDIYYNCPIIKAFGIGRNVELNYNELPEEVKELYKLLERILGAAYKASKEFKDVKEDAAAELTF